jgi:3-oxoacyl-[acyl-carrier-protein] synthase II
VVVRDVVVTGVGAICALGHDCDEILLALEAGRCGIERIRRFDTRGFSVETGAEVKKWPGETNVADGPEAARLGGEFALHAAREALRRSGLSGGVVPARRLGLSLGTGLGGVEHPPHEVAHELAERLGIFGPRLTVGTACSSSTTAIGLACDLLVMGSVDAVLAGGVDVLTPQVFAGFHALGVLTSGRCAPFSTPFGTTLGEGAGFVVLERADAARARGAAGLAAISGYGLAADAYHETSPDPRGAGVARAVRAALADAAIGSEDVDYVNAHGSGTEANDAAEWRGIQLGLPGWTDLPVSSSKGALGHAQGAAGVLEAIVTILLMGRGLVPPTLNFAGARQLAPPDPVGGLHPRSRPVEHALTINSAFGGANAALVLTGPTAAPPRRPARAAVEVLGLGLVGAGERGSVASQNGPTRGRRVPPFSLSELSPRLDPNDLDRSSWLLTAAAEIALQNAAVAPGKRRGPRVGLFVGSVRPSAESFAVFGRGVRERGLASVSGSAFARTVLNAPAGCCSKLLSLKGPLSVVTTGAGSGLSAIVLAAEALATRDDADLIVAAAMDELSDGDDGTTAAGIENAVAIALGRRPAAADTGHVRLAGWGMAGPGQLRAAVDRACSDRSSTGAVECFDERRFVPEKGEPRASPSAYAFAAAVSALRAGGLGRALVTSDLGGAVTVAALLEV